MDLTWMAWTLPSAMFFAAIGVMLSSLTVWELVSPTRKRQGLLPIATTRGDRVFISLLTAAFVHIAWLATTDSSPIGASALSFLFAIAIVRWG